MADRRHGESGVGVVGSIVGLVAFLGFVLLVTQVVLMMFMASVVQAAAVDGADHGAGQGRHDTVRAAQQRALLVLGRLADDATVDSSIRADRSGQVLRVTVSVRPPSGLVRGLGVGSIQRSADARIEQ